MGDICQESDHRIAELIGSDTAPARPADPLNTPQNQKRLFRLLQRQERAAFNLHREDKAAATCGRLAGRSTTEQHDALVKLGVPRDKSIHWTRYRAYNEIARRMNKPRRAALSR